MTISFPRPAFVPSWVWRYLLSVVALAVLASLFVELGRAARVDEPTDLDMAVHAWVVEHRPQWPWVTALARTATRFGNPVTATTSTVLVAFGLIVLRMRGVRGVGRWEPFFWL